MVRKVFKQVWPFLRLALGLGLIIWLLVRFDYGQALKALQYIDPGILGISALLFWLPAVIIQPYKFYWIVRLFYSHGLLHIIRLSLIGYFFNQLLPSSVGGDAVKISLLKNKVVGWTKYIYSALLDRFSGAVVLLAGLGIYVLIWGLPIHVSWSSERDGLKVGIIAAVIAVAVLIAGVSFYKKFKAQWITVLESVRYLRFRDWVKLGSWSAAAHLSYWLATWTLLYSFGVELPLQAAFFALAFSAIAASLPITIGGLGVREGVMIWTLIQMGVPDAIAVNVAVIQRLFILATALLGGGLFLREDRPKTITQPETTGV